MIRVEGRMIREPVVQTTIHRKVVTLRIEDAANPETWIHVTIERDDLAVLLHIVDVDSSK